MEEKKFDINSFIGMLLLGGILIWWMSTQAPKSEENTTTSTEQIKNTTEKENNTVILDNLSSEEKDSIQLANYKNELGAFALSGINGIEGTTTIENKLVKLIIDNKGGQIIEATLKTKVSQDSLPIQLIKDNNASFNLHFTTTDNRVLNTTDLFFTPNLTKNGDDQVLSMKLLVSDSQYLEYRYEMKPNDYLVDFTVRSQGLGSVINSSNPFELDWKLNTYRNEKSLRTENMYSYLYYNSEDEVDYVSANGNETLNDVKWTAFKQHFFSSILLTDKAFNQANLNSIDALDEETGTKFIKGYSFKAPLELSGGELNYNMQWFYGPNEYRLLKSYEGKQLSEIVDLGWGIFGTINRWVFYPIFDVLQGFIGNYGLIIILMTIVVRILMSPLVYKSYVSSAKMKVIRPEMEEINKKFPGKENAMKRQQEIMAVQRKAGVSMMSGCIPALLQMPVFFALFKFFPSNIDLRGESFLWAKDLSSYDVIYNLPFNIPFYGNHISLFPLLASIAIFFYMRMNQSQQMSMQQPTQEGMPDMSKMMKWMIYFSPVMMLIFFNNYASSLSLYYFISNLLTITIMLVIKNYVIDEKKIHAQIEENKKKPKKTSKFRERLDAAMKQAQEQQAKQNRR